MKKRLPLHMVIFLIGLLTVSCSNRHTTFEPSEPPNSKIINPEATIYETTNQEITNQETIDQEITNQETSNPGTTNPGTINTLGTIINDMKLSHEGYPHGVPLSWDWAQRPRLGRGNNPGSFTAMIAWGQLYEDAYGNPAKNTRVQIRDIKAYMLSKSDGQWHLIQKSHLVEGAAFREDFSDNSNINADTRKENDGSISVKAGDGYNFHFWAPNRVLINPDDIAGIFITVQAKLVVDNPDQPDDRLQARYLLEIGGDYWLNLYAKWDYLKTNQDIGMGRFKYVTTDWKAFNMHTLSAEKILQNPPPID